MAPKFGKSSLKMNFRLRLQRLSRLMKDEMVFHYVIIREINCIALRFSGALSPSDVIAATKHLWDDPQYNRTYNIIADLRNCKTGAEVSDIGSLVRFLIDKPSLNRGAWAVVMEDPRMTALGMLFKSRSGFLNRFELFSSWESACRFLDVDLEPSIFDQMETQSFR